MAAEEIKKIIKEFTSVQHKEQALMVCGKWGIGKTYFLKNLKAEELGKKKIVLISLKGIKTREDINRRAVAKILGIGRKLNCLSKGVNAVISKLTSSFSKGWLNISISDLIELGVSWKEFQDVILIFDDFERIDNESIAYSDVLFLIHSAFVEEKNADYVDFGLMCECRHFIISNSTFSWWAAYLGKAENKTVMTPDKWYNNGENKPQLNLNGWIVLKTNLA